MRVALGIVTLSDQGGLQRDFLALADALAAQGHEVAIFAARVVAPWTSSRSVTFLKTWHFSNHGLDRAFSIAFRDAAQGRFDLVVGFNKLAGLDIYYCADPSLAAKPTPLWKRLLPRHRTRLALERACFGPASKTVSLMLSSEVLAAYRVAWQTPEHRLRLLPPRIAAHRVRSDLRTKPHRREQRAALGLADEDFVWLWLATQPVTKGLDRVVGALARQNEARLLVVGIPPDDDKVRDARRQAQGLGVNNRILWLGHREDVPILMASSDLLVHPARLDVTGQVILEAIVNGLPVIASAVCGFARHVAAADAGLVIGEPFEAAALDAALAQACDADLREQWSRNAVAYNNRHDFGRGLDAAAALIEEIGAPRAGAR